MRVYIYNEVQRPYTFRRVAVPVALVLIATILIILPTNSHVTSYNNSPVQQKQITHSAVLQTSEQDSLANNNIAKNTKNSDIVTSLNTQPKRTNTAIVQVNNVARINSVQSSDDINELFLATNIVRVANGLQKLQLHDKLNQSANLKCSDMVNRDYWSHVDPDGNQPWIFFDKVGYTKRSAGENLAYGFKDYSSVIQGWMNSPTHRATILDAKYRDVGFGICTSNNYISTGLQTIIVQHFGTPL